MNRSTWVLFGALFAGVALNLHCTQILGDPYSLDTTDTTALGGSGAFAPNGPSSSVGSGGMGGSSTHAVSVSSSASKSVSVGASTNSVGSGGMGGSAGIGGAGMGGAGGAIASASGGAGGSGGAAVTTGAGGGCSIGHVVISEVRSRGLAGGSDEFVELYNPLPTAVVLDGTWTVQARSSLGMAFTVRWMGSGTSIPANGHYLIAGSTYTQAPTRDGTLLVGITDESAIVLFGGGVKQDAVCYYLAGDAAAVTAYADPSYMCEGTPVVNPVAAVTPSDASMERAPGGLAGNCTDTDNNASDFIAQSPATPENSVGPG